MEMGTAQRLTDMTSDFYAKVASSFGATRQAPWPGWSLLPMMEPSPAISAPTGKRPTLRVLDAACGNLRFERHLATRNTERDRCIEAWCVDACDELVALEHIGSTPNLRICYQHLDMGQALLDGDDLAAAIQAPPCDLAVCFGFMHHLPLASQRRNLLRALAVHSRPGGSIAVSFWQFLRDPRLARKARTFPDADANDYLLGWQDRTDVARYCHHFEEAEIDELVQSVCNLTRQTSRYSADGRAGDLNRYVILQRL